MSHYELSAPACHAARIILRHFDLVQKPNGKIRPTEKNLAILIDVTTGIFRVQEALTEFVRTTPWMDKSELAKNMDRLRESIRAIEIVNNRLPRFEQPELMVTVHEKQNVEVELTRTQIDNIQQISAALESARTVAEEQRVLRAAGIAR